MFGFLWRPANVLLRPVVRAWHRGSKVGWASIPKPADPTHVLVPGDGIDRVLLIGDGPAIGYGVVDHGLALSGHIARQLSAATGRGASVDVIADESLNVHNIERRFTSRPAGEFDVVIVLLGATDAAQLSSVRVWRERLHSFIRRVNQTNTPVDIVLLAIPPIVRMPIITGLSALVGKHHATILNRETARAAAGYPNVTFLPFLPPPEPDPLRYRSAGTYRAWARLITPKVAALLLERGDDMSPRDNSSLSRRTRERLMSPERVLESVAALYQEAGVEPPWSRVWDGDRDVTDQPPDTWPWPWNPNGHRM